MSALLPYVFGRSRSFSELFTPEPEQWGLRGDPHLWRRLSAYLAHLPPPCTEFELVDAFVATFELMTGQPLSSEGILHVKDLDGDGMSAGMVSPEFWRQHMLPLLVRRFHGETQKSI